MKRELRPHQVKAIEMLRQSLGSGKRRPVLQAPTGFGKTLLAAAVVEGALAKKKRVIFTVPALSLVDQAVEAFWNERICDVGVIQGSHPMTDWSRPVQVASVQTLQRRPIPEADVIIIDECHRWFNFYGK
jgi:DNA repair protein RadD